MCVMVWAGVCVCDGVGGGLCVCVCIVCEGEKKERKKEEREEGVKDGPACESGSRANLQFCSRPLRLLLLSVLLLLLIHYHSTEGGGEWGRAGGGQSRTEACRESVRLWPPPTPCSPGFSASAQNKREILFLALYDQNVK